MLEEHFQFKQESLDNYVSGMEFPPAFLSDCEDGAPKEGFAFKQEDIGYDPEHPCAQFMEYLIRVYAAIQEGALDDPDPYQIRLKAQLEAIYLDKQAGAVAFAKSKEELERLGCIGAIETLRELVNDMEAAVQYLENHNFPMHEYPFHILPELTEEARSESQKFSTRDKGFEVTFIEQSTSHL